MTGIITQGKGLFAVMALAVGMLALLACSNQPALGNEGVQSVSNQPGIGSNPAALPAGPASPEIRTAYTAAANGNAGIWVSGTGEASGTPDLAILNLGVEALAETVRESRSQAAEAMAATISALESQGVAREDIQTRTFNIFPRYTRCVTASQGPSSSIQPAFPDSVREIVAVEANRVGGPDIAVEPITLGQPVPKEECFVEYEQVLMGFQVTNQLTVNVRDLDNVGEVIDRVTDAGGDLTRFQSVSFTIEDAKELQDQARVAAIEDIMAKAEQVASVSGVDLGSLVYVTETGGPAPISFNTSRAVMAMAESAPTPILTGQKKVSITVQGGFAIASSAP